MFDITKLTSLSTKKKRPQTEGLGQTKTAALPTRVILVCGTWMPILEFGVNPAISNGTESVSVTVLPAAEDMVWTSDIHELMVSALAATSDRKASLSSTAFDTFSVARGSTDGATLFLGLASITPKITAVQRRTQARYILVPKNRLA
jgi:hypothetical protein